MQYHNTHQYIYDTTTNNNKTIFFFFLLLLKIHLIATTTTNTHEPMTYRYQTENKPTRKENKHSGIIRYRLPQGRLFQVEYAAEAVKQGSCCVGIKSKTHAILGVLKRSPSELASYQEKLFKMDSHLVISISGLTADARYLSDHMRMECLNHRFVYGASLQVGRLVSHISDMHQRCTQDMTYERGRPFGVGLLVAGYDKTGPHIYETSPTAHYYEHKAQAIGARSQSARTYLEKVFETFPDLSVDELVIHALKSLEGAAGDKDLTAESVGIAIVGKDQDVKLEHGRAEILLECRIRLQHRGLQSSVLG